MARKTLLDTEIATVSGINATMPKIIKYLMDNRSCYLDINILRNIYQMRSLIPTACGEIFDTLLESEAISIFCPIRADIGVVPEFIASPEFVLDFKQIPKADVLSSYPEFKNKVLVNLSPILKISKTTPVHYGISDVNALHALYTRAALVASYQDSDGWLNPSIGVFIVKSYCMVISGIIARQFDLTFNEQLTIAAIFAMYMCQALSSFNDDLKFPSLFNRCTFLTGQHSGLVSLAKAMEHLSAPGLNISSICQLVRELGPPRMKEFDTRILYRVIANLGASTIQMAIALEYPPYWVYHLLLAVSNAKIGLLRSLKENRLLSECGVLARELSTSRNFIGGLRR